MTVKHLQSVQRQQLNMAIQSDPGVVQKFKTGFVECAEEVNRYVSQMDGIDTGVRQRLSAHLNNCANSLEQIGSMSNFSNGYRGGLFPSAPATAAPTPLFPSLPQDLNNNSRSESSAPAIQMGGLQLIPSRLPSGEFALIMPNTGSTAPPPGPFAWPGSAAGVAAGTASAALASIANPTHLSDYTQSFRMSAFSKPASNAAPANLQGSLVHPLPVQTQLPAKNSTSSPPLSPISSISSHGEESRSASPTVDVISKHSFAGVFTTPPPTSAETSFNTSGSLNLSAGSHDSSGCSRSLAHLQQHQVSSTSGIAKRDRDAEAESSDCSLDEPSSKKFLAGAIEKSSSAWRPW